MPGIRPFRLLYCAVLGALAYWQCGWWGVLFVALATLDVELEKKK